MDLNPRLKRCPTISLRGTDCFVLCYCNGELIERLRMSLLSGIDTAHAVIPRASESSEFVVNELRVPVTLETKESGPVMLVNSKYELRMSPEPSVWCI
ncbi:hypothetical protein SDRG_07157 [Saprolegnia diclina VS20]|uniref:Uncharacterized protein n=1 Tax=Saprolegnia diclina (strain VS20) TaxID=1156394 RepID=T0RYI5_SAPDV|nr:hypothetical protein SDRG_07157 [Saprolegnia diclina VS20]EQC35447.1 hypothetical protein SDRG_07157 [Saprolegnia diclina VS20]|eukprot:XP_008611197.1 hypothetical protein SDRG_07157 [Saprolegnia diclina VS20]